MDRRTFVGTALLASLPLSRLSRLGRLARLSSLDATKSPWAGGAVDLRDEGRRPLLVTDPIDPPFEEAWPITPTYSWPAPMMLGEPGIREAGTGRAVPLLRAFAAEHDPQDMLANAVLILLKQPIRPRAIPLKFASEMAPLVGAVLPEQFGVALAQLAVTGRAAYTRFAQWNPQDADLVQLVHQFAPGQTFDQPALASAAQRVLDAAYSTAWEIRANDVHWRNTRVRSGWIAASGEDDLPHRPVNIPTSRYPQYDLLVHIVGDLGPLAIWTRYTVAVDGNSIDGHMGGYAVPAPAPGTLRTLPVVDFPNIPPDNKIIIYIHGGGSRAEEADLLASQLIAEGKKLGQHYTVIAFDMPNSGFCGYRQGPNGAADLSPFDHTDVSPSGTSYHPSGNDKLQPPSSPWHFEGYRIMEFEERFVIEFIEALDQAAQQHNTRIKPRIAAVMGGSLGGNMSMQLARRADEYPYLRTMVAWSSTILGTADDATVFFTGHQLAGIGGDLIGKFSEAESDGTRKAFFDALYNQPLANMNFLGLGSFYIPPQPTMWWRSDWPWINQGILQSKYDRFEYYTPQFRRWTHRLNYEMTIFSFQEGDVFPPNHALGPQRFDTVKARLLLAGAAMDDYRHVGNYTKARNLAPRMIGTGGTTLFLNHTGHSIHDERPTLFAQHIVQFLGLGTMALKVARVSRTKTDATVVVTASDAATGLPIKDAMVSIYGVTRPVGTPITYPVAPPADCLTTIQEGGERSFNERGEPLHTSPKLNSKTYNECVGTVSRANYESASFSP